MRKKLRSQRGDTLVETLANKLNVVQAKAIHATSIVTAARINAGVRETDTSLHYDGSAAPVQETLTITRQGGTGTGSAVRKSVSVYETEGGYRYYVYQE